MSENEIPKEVKDFVFHWIDSAEQLEILLLLHSQGYESASAKELSDVLRSSPHSVDKRIQNLLQFGLLISVGSKELPRFRFHVENDAAFKIVSHLAEVFKSHRYGILELIFSPLKKSRDFAEAFKIAGPKDPSRGGESNG